MLVININEHTCTFFHPNKLINLEMIQFSGRPGIHQGQRNDILYLYCICQVLSWTSMYKNVQTCTFSIKLELLENGSEECRINWHDGLFLFYFLFNTYFTSVVPTALLLQCNWPITGIRRVL